MKIYTSPSMSYFWQQMATRSLTKALNARRDAEMDPKHARIIRIRVRYHAKAWRQYVELARKHEGAAN